MIELGIGSIVATIPDPVTGNTVPAADRMADLLPQIATADRLGLDVFGVGGHFRNEFLDVAPALNLAAAAALAEVTCRADDADEP